MLPIIIGSRAIKAHFPDFREPVDTDILLPSFRDIRIFKQTNNVMVDAKPVRACRKILYEQDLPIIEVQGIKCLLPSPQTLIEMKRSHLYWPLNWEKHIADYNFLRSKGLQVDFAGSFYKGVLAEAIFRFKEKKYSMKVPNSEFFNYAQKRVGRSYNHDDLHYATCYHDEPLYQKCKHDRSLAYVDMKLYKAMSHEDQVRMVREESYVIALERTLIPAWLDNRPVEPQRAFMEALKRISTRLTRGYFRDFAIENHVEIAAYDKDFFSIFVTAEQAGKVRKYDA